MDYATHATQSGEPRNDAICEPTIHPFSPPNACISSNPGGRGPLIYAGSDSYDCISLMRSTIALLPSHPGLSNTAKVRLAHSSSSFSSPPSPSSRSPSNLSSASSDSGDVASAVLESP
ncbi:hypothetical protein K443DRAFT_670860 [Laccaria amethystina LaAM-08-1]|uniref:Uncharacterized protein n=1 Tax=Laccaria amethystina LaAM-08-1 TaxID=1095629 RepID=A0A0C9XD80_9AGAR|nr:hypothetical protein K443DRAFT_670860 [Laccaria amethystina LaAM-08-1]